MKHKFFDRKDKKKKGSNLDKDWLGFNSKLLLNLSPLLPETDIYETTEKKEGKGLKYSIDLSEAPKNKIQEYLNSDLIDELDKIPEEDKKTENSSSNVKREEEDFHSKEQKAKKPFEIREGDWTCFDCHNLNFSFRKKCNRCGLDKEISISKYFNAQNELMKKEDIYESYLGYDTFYYSGSNNGSENGSNYNYDNNKYIFGA